MAKFMIDGITAAPAGQEQLDITFRKDANGILKVTVKDVRTDNTESLTIETHKSNLPAKEIIRLIELGEFERQRDKKRKA